MANELDVVDRMKVARAIGGRAHMVLRAHEVGGLRQKLQYICSYRLDWQERYFARGYLDLDPLPYMALVRSGPTMWSEVASAFPKAPVMQEARDFGLTEGVAISHAGYVVSIPTDSRLSQLEAEELLRMLKSELTEAAFNDAKLTEKQMGVLSLLSSGFSQPQIAGMTGVSEHAVKETVAQIVRNLGVSTSAQACILHSGLASIR